MNTCECPACKALGERYATDPELLAFYRRNLLIRGWAGDSDAVEKAYSQAHAEWARKSAERARVLASTMPRFGQKVPPQSPSLAEAVSEDLESISPVLIRA